MAITAVFPTYTGGDIQRTSNQAAFDAAINYFFDYHKNHFQPTTNAFANQANSTEANMNLKEASTSLNSASALDSKEKALEYKNGAVSAYNQTKAYIDTLVIPTAATLSESAILAKVRMSQVLTLTNSI